MKTNFIEINRTVLLLPIALWISTMISGCGITLLSERASNPVIQDFSSPFFNNSSDIFATKASHRLFLIQKRNGKLITCAEPSPDVAEAVTTAVTDNFKLSLQEPKSSTSVEAQNQYAHMLATEIAPLLYRTQGLQLYRNAASDLCIDYMNGVFNDAQGKPDDKLYKTEKYNRFTRAADLIEKELNQMDKTAESFYKNFKTSGPKLSINDVAKLVNAFDGTESQESSTPPSPVPDTLKPLVVEPTKSEITESKNTGSVNFDMLKMTDDSVLFAVAAGADLTSAVDANGTVLTLETDKKSVKITKKVSVTLSLTNLNAGRDVIITVAGTPSGAKEVFKFAVVTEAK